MFKLYEVDPAADVLLVLPGSGPPPLTPKDGRLGRGQDGPRARPELRLKVSSKHLSLVSRPFRDRLTWGRQEESPDGRLHVLLDGRLDPAAVTTVMDIIHGRGRRAPRTVDLQALAEIAVVVDQFQFYDAVEAYAERWIGQLEGSLGGSPEADLVRWVYVGYVFHRADLFKRASGQLIQCTGPLYTLGLPIREKITRAIETRRQEAAGGSAAVLQDLLDGLRDGDVACEFECDALLLGRLTKLLRRNPPSLRAQPSLPPPPLSSASLKGIGFENRAAILFRGGPESVHPAAQTSPSSLLRGFGADFGSHECPARALVSSKLEALSASSTEGLELESSLGYYLY